MTALSADQIKPGDKLAVLADASNPAAGFTAAVVDSVQPVQDPSGLFLPAISKPFLLVDGVVAPL